MLQYFHLFAVNTELLNSYLEDSRVILTFDETNNKFICEVKLLGITGDMTYIVKKNSYSELVYGL